ncbi:MAG TPA: methionyl-tRNA formyltransferase [Bacteroidales bacterium]|nr:methionyl-tRNA formyltransferase [Bacteroidales bacterium]
MAGPRIIFMGTPEFAVPSLGALIMNGYDIVAVVSSPDKPAGRGLKMRRSAVSKFASDNLIRLLQPYKLSEPSFINDIQDLKPDIMVVVAFRKLPAEVWKIPAIGTFNLHASLLPQYKGAAPINHAIINGEKSSGITSFLLDETIDTGKIIFQQEIAIAPDDSAGNLHDKMMREGAKLVVNTVKALFSGKVKTIDQSTLIKDKDKLKKAPKINSKDCYIDWDRKNSDVYNFIRGLFPHPGARTIFRKGSVDHMVKIGKCKCMKEHQHLGPGEIDSDGKNYLMIGTAGCAIDIERLQLEGRKFMSVQEFLRGFDIKNTLVIKGPPA